MAVCVCVCVLFTNIDGKGVCVCALYVYDARPPAATARPSEKWVPETVADVRCGQWVGAGRFVRYGKIPSPPAKGRFPH